MSAKCRLADVSEREIPALAVEAVGHRNNAICAAGRTGAGVFTGCA